MKIFRKFLQKTEIEKIEKDINSENFQLNCISKNWNEDFSQISTDTKIEKIEKDTNSTQKMMVPEL